jgi:uncharacterized repeat protein (TIGR01451 family)
MLKLLQNISGGPLNRLYRFKLPFFVLTIVLLFQSTAALAVTNFDWPNNPTEPDTVIKNGDQLTHIGVDTHAGSLFVGFSKLGGTRTSAATENTQQDATAVEDTVLNTPGDSVHIVGYIDLDNPTEVSSNVDGAETNDSSTAQVAFIDKNDTAYFRINIKNTGNGAETFVFVLNAWDTDPNGTGSEGNTSVVDNFRVSFTTSHQTAATAANDSEAAAIGGTTLGAGGTGDYPAQITWGDQAIVPPGGETYVWLRVAGNDVAARDTIGLTVWFYADTSPNSTSKITRFSHDSGYTGDNDTQYVQGSSQDSISVFVEAAFAVVRVHKSDTVWAPKTYTDVTGSNGNFDAVPGATILYEIIYDNDGNRGADSIVIIDFLPAEVDLKIDSFVNGIDTDLAHTRYMFQSSNWDTSVNVNFSSRGDSENFNDTSNIAFTGTAYSGKVVDTVAAIRITFNGKSNFARLAADNGNDNLTQADGGSLDNSGLAKTAPRSDSGDVGIIRYSVVIR